MEMSEHECKFLRCWDIFPYHTEYGAVDFQRHSIQKTCGILSDKLFSICLNHEFLRRIMDIVSFNQRIEHRLIKADLVDNCCKCILILTDVQSAKFGGVFKL